MLATSAATLKPSEIAEMGQEIFKSSQRLQRLIENFLIYAQIELVAADPKNVNALRIGKLEHPAPLVKKLAAVQAAQVNRPNDLTVDATDVLLPMSEEYFSRVVNELVHNAFKFSEPGAPVRITLTADADFPPSRSRASVLICSSSASYTTNKVWDWDSSSPNGSSNCTAASFPLKVKKVPALPSSPSCRKQKQTEFSLKFQNGSRA
jgi:hypothetical protein